MGGSPGNYGILTHLQILPLHDEKYTGSHAMKVTTPYTKEKLEKCAQVMAEMSDDPDFPRNFDYFLAFQRRAQQLPIFQEFSSSRKSL